MSTVTRTEYECGGLIRLRRVVDLDVSPGMAAARLSVDLRLPMADSLILATAQAQDAILWTQDSDFEDLPGVRYRRAAPSPPH